MKLRSLYSFILLFITGISFAQKPSAFAGPDYPLCPDGSKSAVLGASTVATGGTPPYSYLWTPATGLSNNSVPNPTVTISTQITYTLEVRDANDSIGKDFVTVFISNLMQYTAG